MEIMDTEILERQLAAAERAHRNHPSEMNTARLGIVYHEVALNLSFLTDGNYQGYARRSYDLLTELYQGSGTTPELMPFVASYRASALALVSAETGKLKPLNRAFRLFDEAVARYAEYSYAPEFLRGSVSENLPKLFFLKRRHAARDFGSIIDKYHSNEDYASGKIMSFTYWAWAAQHRGKRDRSQALNYLRRAIELDPAYEAGRERAEKLLKEFQQ